MDLHSDCYANLFKLSECNSVVPLASHLLTYTSSKTKLVWSTNYILIMRSCMRVATYTMLHQKIQVMHAWVLSISLQPFFLNFKLICFILLCFIFSKYFIYFFILLPCLNCHPMWHFQVKETNLIVFFFLRKNKSHCVHFSIPIRLFMQHFVLSLP